ncbi:hypothetical protein AAVH_27558 [Aphelenchoides avenae]|nr:hypothetical protein AAVH_27558 [Aphelenchus avenae]
MGRKEIEFDAAMNEIAAIAAGGWLGAPKEELADRLAYARQKASVLAYRAFEALTEYNKLQEKVESTPDLTKKKRLDTLLGRKATEFDEAMSKVVVIAGDSEQGSSTQLNDVSARMNEVLVLKQLP